MLPLPILAADVGVQTAVVEGYNSNTYQTQTVLGGPVTRHPALYTGAQASLGVSDPGRGEDTTQFRLYGRAQHYEALDGAPQTDDGSAGAVLSTNHAISNNTKLGGILTLTVATLNSAHISDGALIAWNPIAQRSTFWLGAAAVTLSNDIAPTWRYQMAAGTRLSGTLSEQFGPGFEALPSRKLGSISPNVSATLSHETSDRTRFDVNVLADYTFTQDTYDFSRTPPRDLGVSGFEDVTPTVGWLRNWTEGLATILRAGATIATPGVGATTGAPYLVPVARGELFYARDLWTLQANAGYQFAAFSPGIGAGAGYGGGVSILGRPFPRGAGRELYVVAAATGSRYKLESGVVGATVLAFAGGSAEVRYGISRYLGLLVGYDAHYAVYESGTPLPSLFRQLVFLGISGSFSTDDALPPVSTVTIPSKPGA